MNDSKEICRLLPLGAVFGLLTKGYLGAITKRLEHLEIERYYSVLIVVECFPGKCTQKYISDTLSIDKVSMVRILDHLVEKDYIKRDVNPSDRRSHLIALTSKAKVKMKEIHHAISEINQAVISGLTQEQEKQLYNSLGIMMANLPKLPANKFFINFKKSGKSKKN